MPRTSTSLFQVSAQAMATLPLLLLCPRSQGSHRGEEASLLCSTPIVFPTGMWAAGVGQGGLQLTAQAGGP